MSDNPNNSGNSYDLSVPDLMFFVSTPSRARVLNSTISAEIERREVQADKLKIEIVELHREIRRLTDIINSKELELTQYIQSRD